MNFKIVMNMNISRAAIVIMSLFLPVTALCQNGDASNFQKMVDFLPPAPNAAAMIKYNAVSINKNTGSPNISIPFFTLKGTKLSADVSIGYSSTGLKVDEIASRVGMGWSLNAGGVITRTVRGWADEYGTRIEPPSVLTNNYALFQFCDNIVSSNNYGNYDSEPDLFNFTMNGISGSFVFDENMVPVLIPAEKFKVIKHQPTPTENYDFVIITTDGVSYYFGGSTATEKTKRQTSCGKSFETYFPNAWYLIQIKHPNGETIDFTYTPLTYVYDGGVSETKYAKPYYSHIDVGMVPDPSMAVWCNCCPNGDCPNAPGAIECFNLVNTQGWLLSQIRNSNSYISFDYQTRSDCTDRLVSSIQLFINQNLAGKFNLDYSPIHADDDYKNNDSYGYAYTPFLKKIEEVATGVQAKTHLFEYNNPGTRAPRLSYAQDHWGYFNGKKNTTMIPPPVDNYTRQFFPTATANREPDPVFASIGMLTKVVYPTGGVTKIEYEPNEVYKANQTFSTPYEYSCSVVGAGDHDEISKTFVFTIDHPQKVVLNVNTALTGNGTYISIHNGASVTIYNTNGPLIYEEGFPAGVSDIRSINAPYDLPAGSYTMIFAARGTSVFINVKLTYYPTTSTSSKTSRIVGGVRVKRVITGNPDEKPMIKRYYYAEPDDLTRSSLLPVQFPTYYKLIKNGMYCSMAASNGTGSTGSTTGFCELFVMSSGSLNNLFTYHNSPISYSSVIESDGENFENGAIQSKFFVAPDVPAQQIWLAGEPGSNTGTPPVLNAPLSNYGSTLNGKLQKEIILKKLSGVLVPLKETVYAYSIDDRAARTIYGYLVNKNYDYPGSWFPSGGPLSTPTSDPVANAFTIMKYHVVSRWVHPELKTEIVYDETGANPVSTTTYSYFDNEEHLQLTRTEVLNSKEQLIKTINTYPAENAGTAPYDDMIIKNIITPIVTTETVINDNVSGDIPLSKSFMDYTDAGNGNFVPSIIRKSIKGSDPQIVGTIDLYDLNGNILQYTGKNGIVTSILWGYDRLYPVAQVVGVTHEMAEAQFTVTYDQFQELGETDLLIQINHIRTNLPEARVTSYTYTKAGGVASITDPNNRKNSYEYDPFNRLYIVLDQDGNIVKKNEYLYTTPDADAKPKIFFNEAVVQTFQCQCLNGFAGSMVQYSIPFGKYYSLESQPAADAQVVLDTDGQEYANRNGKCTSTLTCNGEGYRVVNCNCVLGTKVYENAPCTSVNTDGSWMTYYHYEWTDGVHSSQYSQLVDWCNTPDKRKIGCECVTGTKICDNVQNNGNGTYTVEYHYNWSVNPIPNPPITETITCSGPDKKMIGCNCETGFKICHESIPCNSTNPPSGCCPGMSFYSRYRYHFSDGTMSDSFYECTPGDCSQ